MLVLSTMRPCVVPPGIKQHGAAFTLVSMHPDERRTVVGDSNDPI
jgi:hypothetical protein